MSERGLPEPALFPNKREPGEKGKPVGDRLDNTGGRFLAAALSCKVDPNHVEVSLWPAALRGYA